MNNIQTEITDTATSRITQQRCNYKWVLVNPLNQNLILLGVIQHRERVVTSQFRVVTLKQHAKFRTLANISTRAILYNYLLCEAYYNPCNVSMQLLRCLKQRPRENFTDNAIFQALSSTLQDNSNELHRSYHG